MNMKKVLALALTAALTIGLTACGGGQQQTSTPGGSSVSSGTSSGSGSQPEETPLSGTVVIYSTQTDVDHEVFLEIFNQQYPDVKVEFISDSLGALVARVEAEQGKPQGDVIFGGLSQTDGDQYLHLLQPYTPKYASECAVPSNDYYTWFAYQYICLITNTEMLEDLGVEVKGYQDLLQPELKGRIYQADPGASSSAWRQLQTMLAVMGSSFADDQSWDYCKALIENSDGISTNSSSAVYKSVYNGEYAVGLTYDNGAISLLMSGAEGVEIVWPEEGNTVCAFASAMIKDCPHPELAAAVLDTLSSAEFQLAREQAAGSRGPNTTYTNADSYFPADIDDGVVDLDFAAIAGQKNDLIEKWNDMWAAVNS